MCVDRFYLFVPVSVNLRDILKRPEELLTYMTQTLKIDPQVANQFLNSSYTLAKVTIFFNKNS